MAIETIDTFSFVFSWRVVELREGLPIPSKISQSSGSTTKYATLKVRFGNGYEQRTQDGINDKQSAWTITYNNLTTAERSELWNFLDAVKGTRWFRWTPYGETTKKWVVDGDVAERVLSGEIYSISFPIRQVFDLY